MPIQSLHGIDRMSYSYLVGEGVTKVVRGSAATWQAGVKDDDAIVCRGTRIA